MNSGLARGPVAQAAALSLAEGAAGAAAAWDAGSLRAGAGWPGAARASVAAEAGARPGVLGAVVGTALLGACSSMPFGLPAAHAPATPAQQPTAQAAPGKLPPMAVQGVLRTEGSSADTLKRGYSTLARNYEQEGRWPQAAEAWGKAAALAPHDPDVLNGWGVALARAGRLNDALPVLARAAEVSSDSARAWNNYGHALRLAGRADEAVTALQRALRLDPAHVQARQNLMALRPEAMAGIPAAAGAPAVPGASPSAGQSAQPEAQPATVPQPPAAAAAPTAVAPTTQAQQPATPAPAAVTPVPAAEPRPAVRPATLPPQAPPVRPSDRVAQFEPGAAAAAVSQPALAQPASPAVAAARPQTERGHGAVGATASADATTARHATNVSARSADLRLDSPVTASASASGWSVQRVPDAAPLVVEAAAPLRLALDAGALPATVAVAGAATQPAAGGPALPAFATAADRSSAPDAVAAAPTLARSVQRAEVLSQASFEAPAAGNARPTAPGSSTPVAAADPLAGVRVVVVNGMGVTGAAASVRAQWLAPEAATGTTAAAAPAVRLANGSHFNTQQTTLRYAPGFEAAAQALAQRLPGVARIQMSPMTSAQAQGHAAPLVLTLGHDQRPTWVAMAAPARDGSSSTGVAAAAAGPAATAARISAPKAVAGL